MFCYLGGDLCGSARRECDRRCRTQSRRCSWHERPVRESDFDWSVYLRPGPWNDDITFSFLDSHVTGYTLAGQEWLPELRRTGSTQFKPFTLDPIWNEHFVLPVRRGGAVLRVVSAAVIYSLRRRE